MYGKNASLSSFFVCITYVCNVAVQDNHSFKEGLYLDLDARLVWEIRVRLIEECRQL